MDSNLSSFHRAFQTLGGSISAIFQVTGLQLGSKFSSRGPALGRVKKFHPLFVKNRIKMNQEPAQSIRIDSNRSGFSMALQTLGGSISAIFQVTGLQLGSKFSPRGPALGYVKKFHPLLVKNERKH